MICDRGCQISVSDVASERFPSYRRFAISSRSLRKGIMPGSDPSISRTIWAASPLAYVPLCATSVALRALRLWAVRSRSGRGFESAGAASARIACLRGDKGDAARCDGENVAVGLPDAHELYLW
jgi:hypothetical protein